MNRGQRPDGLPDVLCNIVPEIGSLWEWEPLAPHARVRCIVTDLRWNGEECWVEADCGYGRRVWNSLSRWVEATVLISVDPSVSGHTRPGYLLNAQDTQGPIVDLHPELRTPK